MPPSGPSGPRGPPIGLRPRPGGGTGPPTELSRGTRSRIRRGVLAGLLGAVVAGAVVVAGTRTGWLALPRPLAVALVDQVLPVVLSRPLLLGLATVAHLIHGAFWGTVLALARDRVHGLDGIGLAAALWVVATLLVMPLAGWGLMGQALEAPAAMAMVGPTVVYGLVVSTTLSAGRPLDPGPEERLWVDQQGPA